MNWLDLLVVQGTLKSLLLYHTSKALILWCSAFFIVQLSHPYMTTWKTIALTRWTFVLQVMSLLFNMLSQFSSVQFRHSVTSNSLWHHESQHARPPCPSPSPEVCPSSCPSSRWCHPTVSSSYAFFSSALSLSQHPDLLHELALCVRWPKYWSFSFSISPSNEYSGLISSKIDRFDLLITVIH